MRNTFLLPVHAFTLYGWFRVQAMLEMTIIEGYMTLNTFPFLISQIAIGCQILAKLDIVPDSSGFTARFSQRFFWTCHSDVKVSYQEVLPLQKWKPFLSLWFKFTNVFFSCRVKTNNCNCNWVDQKLKTSQIIISHLSPRCGCRAGGVHSTLPVWATLCNWMKFCYHGGLLSGSKVLLWVHPAGQLHDYWAGMAPYYCRRD